MSKKERLSKRTKAKGFLKGFKNFITKGNVVDMAVGVIIGGAFGKIITSLVNDIILPPIGVLLGGMDFKDLRALIRQTAMLDDAGNQIVIDNVAQYHRVYINYGNFIQNIIEFLIIAFAIYFVLFFIIKRKQMEEQLIAEQLAKKSSETTSNEPVIVELPADIQLLSEIRDLLKSTKDK